MKHNTILLGSLVLFVLSFPLESITISEKRQNLSGGSSQYKTADQQSLAQVNQALQEKHKELQNLYNASQQAYTLALAQNQDSEAVETLFKGYLEQIQALRKEIKELEDSWKLLSQSGGDVEQEGLWHQPDTTIGQLVIDYGSGDFIYLMPPEIATLKVHVSSQLSVPRAMWSEMLELILSNYGVGIKQLNPFLRQLFFLRLNQADLVAIMDDQDELKLTPPDARICFVLQPHATELKRIYQFLEKFSPQEQMSIQVIGNNIVMVGLAREITEMMKIYDFISLPKHSQEYRLVALQKAQSEEVAKILQAIFEGDGFKFFGDAEGGGKDNHLPFMSGDGGTGFKVLTLKTPAQSLFLLGKVEQIEKACQIIQEIETRVSEAQEKTVHWYACRHSEAEELADVLAQVYTKMIESPDAFNLGNNGKKGDKERSRRSRDIKETITNRTDNDKLVVTPPKVKPDAEKRKTFEKHENFIVDTKTNSIVMVVEANVLPKLRELVKKLDVPKKMVQIDVLLFEKRVSDNNTFGLNLLKMGTAASHKHRRSTIWNQGGHARKKKKHHHSSKHRDNDDHDEIFGDKGVLQFIISRTQHGHVPAFDLAYNFLLAQTDIQINANPTVTTVNQVAARIAIVEQISINTGVVEIDTTKATRLKDSYSREEYGTILSITPTIHAKMDDDDEEADSPKFIHLSTDIVFDTVHGSEGHDRPDITRRNIKNEVRVADGETVILGGLRRKTALDDAEMMPFLGELPGVGKLFGITKMEDTSTEMFIFITPRIVPDKLDEFRKLRQDAIKKRPGDVPEFLQELIVAREKDKRRLFEGSMKLLLGRPDNSFLEAKKP
ncbi:MAG: type II secretion system protein GspD [Verrucomicrobia bacterium]|nr:type II secretion system protein GspD [Verrucomicrobiota bacterium]MBS0637030.1 type II secretion system protein GspD [Verrucomicrobiota bacterium]